MSDSEYQGTSGYDASTQYDPQGEKIGSKVGRELGKGAGRLIGNKTVGTVLGTLGSFAGSFSPFAPSPPTAASQDYVSEVELQVFEDVLLKMLKGLNTGIRTVQAVTD